MLLNFLFIDWCKGRCGKAKVENESGDIAN
jgi:hypothetical protein